MTRVLSDLGAIQRECLQRRSSGRKVALVPTMGGLHAGHRALMAAARESCDDLVVSIFVNPLQFAPNEDFATYPRELEADVEVCTAEGVDLVLSLQEHQMYPPGFATFVHVEGLTDVLEGAARPHHFRGVTTVVAKIYQLVFPHIAYFGQKDAQQALILSRMTRDLSVPVDVRVLPTVREADGLALSTRNRKLSAEHREQAAALYRGLRQAQLAYEEQGVRRVGDLLDRAREPLTATEASVEYVELVALPTLDSQPENVEVPEPAMIAVAASFGATRLIDNVLLPATTDLAATVALTERTRSTSTGSGDAPAS